MTSLQRDVEIWLIWKQEKSSTDLKTTQKWIVCLTELKKRSCIMLKPWNEKLSLDHRRIGKYTGLYKKRSKFDKNQWEYYNLWCTWKHEPERDCLLFSCINYLNYRFLIWLYKQHINKHSTSRAGSFWWSHVPDFSLVQCIFAFAACKIDKYITNWMFYGIIDNK